MGNSGVWPSMIVLRIPTPTHFRVRALEWAMAAIMVTWGLILAQPYPTFSNANFQELAAIGPEWAWAVVCVAVGVARLAALYVNGAWSPSPIARLIASILSVAFWFQITLGMAASPMLTTGLAVYPWFVAFEVYNAGRAASDARLSKEARNAKPEAPAIPVA